MALETNLKATIYDVARDAGVGISTVSRVLNDSPNVNPDTRERVRKSIEKLNFYPNANARGLTSGKITTIGIIVPFFFRHFFMEILLGIGDEVTNHGYDLLLYNVDEPSKKKDYLQKIIGERKLNGLISISLPLDDDDVKALQLAKIPVIMLDNQHPQVNSIYIDNQAGAHKAVSHIIAQGHKRIAMINGALEDPFHFSTSRERLAGYKQALRDAEIDFDKELVRIGDWHKVGGYEAMEELLSLEKPPTAVFCASDLMALGAMEKIKKRGIKIPDDFAVCGYDDMEFAQYTGLTSMHQPLDILGEMGAKILLGAITEGKYKKQNIKIEPELIARESTIKERRATQQTEYNA